MMTKLQNLCFPLEEICPDSALYFHEDEGRIRLDGYFNLIFLEKWKAYTTVQDFVLKVRASGVRRLEAWCGGKLTAERELPGTPEECTFSLPGEILAGRTMYFAFVKEPGGGPWQISGAVYGRTEEALRETGIGIDICTFRREAELARNLRALKTHFFDRGEEAAEHVRIFVVDNGRTLDSFAPVRELQESFGELLEILPNRNSGGAGGFARGMLRILETREKYGFTHVLLQDDDAVTDPESIVRIYGLLRTLKEAWKDVTVGGNLLNVDHPNRLCSSGEWWDQGVVIFGGLNWDLRRPECCTDVRLTGTGLEHERYSGWWCCCFSLNTVRRDNLPLPLFLHHDDIEFGMRNRKQGTVFLNGIGVWHRTFEHSYPNANLYYDTRNLLIELVLQYGTVSRKNFWRFVIKPMISGALLLNYRSARFVYQGFLDFLKGPEWLAGQDPERLNSIVRSHALAFVPPEEAEQILGQRQTERLRAEAEEIRRRYAEEGAEFLETRKVKASLLHKLTVNGLLLPPEKEAKLYLASDPPYVLFRRKQAVLLDIGSGRFAVMKREPREMRRTVRLIVRAWTGFFTKAPGAVRSWKEGAARLTAAESWERYLGLNEVSGAEDVPGETGVTENAGKDTFGGGPVL